MLGTSILIYFFSKGKQLQQLFKAVKSFGRNDDYHVWFVTAMHY